LSATCTALREFWWWRDIADIGRLLRLSTTTGNQLDAPTLQGVEDLLNAVSIGPLAALDIEMDLNFLAYLEAVEKIGAVLNELENNEFGILGVGCEFENDIAFAESIADLLNAVNAFDFSGNVHALFCPFRWVFVFLVAVFRCGR